MRFSDAARVGLAVLAAAACLAFLTFWLRGNVMRGGTYTRQVAFPNAQGIQQGALVRVRGVEMGRVERVGLGPDGNPLLTLRIRNEYRLQPNDAIRISGGLLGFNPPWIEITPGGRREAAAPSEVLTGEAGLDTDRLVGQGERLMENLTELSERMTRLTGSLSEVAEDPKLRRNLVRTADNLAKFSDRGLVIAANMERATARADRLIAGFQGTSGQLDRTLRRADRLMASFSGTAGETRALMADSRALVRDSRDVVRSTGEVVRSSGDVVRNTNDVVRNAGGLVTETRAALGENRERLAQVFQSLDASLKSLDATLADARGFLTDPTLRRDLRETAENTRIATENLKRVSQDVESLTGDPKVQEDLRATVSGLREATEEATAALRRVREVLGGGTGKVRNIRERFAETSLDAALLHGTRSDRTRIDFNATLPWSRQTFYRLGFYDLGERNRLNAQVGKRLGSGLYARYGFHASRLGVGLDVGNGRKFPLQLDLYGIRHPRVDLRGDIRVSPYLNLTLGLENLQSRPDPLIGISYKR